MATWAPQPASITKEGVIPTLRNGPFPLRVAFRLAFFRHNAVGDAAELVLVE